MAAGKKRLSGDVVREARTDGVKVLRSEKAALKETLSEVIQLVAELIRMRLSKILWCVYLK